MNNKPLGQLSNDDYFELKQYRCLGTVEELTKLKRSRLPLKVSEDYPFFDCPLPAVIYKCPACYRFSIIDKMEYCGYCGQHVEIPDYMRNNYAEPNMKISDLYKKEGD